jgi:hypothetical protein
MSNPSLAVIGVPEGRDVAPLGIELVLVFKSNFFGRWRVLAWSVGDIGCSFLTTTFALPVLREDLGDRLSSDGVLSFVFVPVLASPTIAESVVL